MIKSLEGLRGVAALMVALFHLKIGMTYISPIKHGYLFVDLFFVLSGFVIAGAYSTKLETRAQFLSFMLRRWGRIFPLLLVATSLFLLMQNTIVAVKIQLIARGMASALKNPGHLEYIWPTWDEITSTLTFTHSMGVYDKLILNYASWSISVEFWAYVLFGVLCCALPRRIRIIASLLLAAAAYAITVWASVSGDHQCLTQGKCMSVAYDFGYFRCVFSFLLGTLLWEVRGAARHLEGVMQVAAVGAILALFSVADAAPAVAFLFPFAFCVLIWSMARDTGPIARLLAGRVSSALGMRSYSAYMLHPVLLLVFSPLADRVHGLAAAIAISVTYLTTLLLISGWAYRLVEAPARKYVNSVASRLDDVPRGGASVAT